MMKKNVILCVGADIKNRFLVEKNGNLYPGSDIGDLSDASNYTKFKKEIFQTLGKLKAKPDQIACDFHPDYFSTKFAKTFNLETQVPLCSVQHHHAHIASVMQEHCIKRPVIGVSFDGTGFGLDGRIWGGEFLLVNGSHCKRLAHFKYIQMPGGDRVVREPWRMVLSILGSKAMALIKSVKKEDKEIILSMMAKDINSPLVSSAGRLFDAAAAIMGLCAHASYEAEGPMKLEALCEDKIQARYDFRISKHNGCYLIDVEPLFLGIVNDLKKGKRKSIMATKFHNSIIDIIKTTIQRLSKETGIERIALSGGVFQNKFLKTKITKQLCALKFDVLTNVGLPVNDFNIAWGQYYVSCCLRKG